MTKRKPDRSVEEDQENAETRRRTGEFVRGVSGFRHSIGDPEFPAEPDRYHLFVAFNCPWSHRATLARGILGLQKTITMDVAFPSRTNNDDPSGPNLWEFNPTRSAALTGEPLPECTDETGTGKRLRLTKEIYALEGSAEQSVPILYDKRSGRIVNNESAEILRMLDKYADALGSTIATAIRPRLCPDDSQAQVELKELNHLIYASINNGAYKAGFSSDQNVYAAAFAAYFHALSELESKLASDERPFFLGDQFTEVDLRLFPTLYRHDPIYYVRMKLNGARILDYPNLWRWLCRVYAIEGVKQSSSLIHCRQGYFGRSWNNTIPLGPVFPMTYPEAYEHPNLCEN
ncbi:MAG: glutathione S-transferase C-terminal domain-containing protein [Pseudomonadota bacterium]